MNSKGKKLLNELITTTKKRETWEIKVVVKSNKALNLTQK